MVTTPKIACCFSLLLMATVGLGDDAIPVRARSRGTGIPPPRPALPIGQPIIIKPPLGLPPVPVPKDNPITEETVFLGRKLFFDKLFSRDNTVACASCHDPRYGFADPRRVSEGVNGLKGTRNAPTVLNAAYNEILFWDGRAPTLEAQAAGPVDNPVELAHSLVGVERKLAGLPDYVDLFEKAWGPGRIDRKSVV